MLVNQYYLFLLKWCEQEMFIDVFVLFLIRPKIVQIVRTSRSYCVAVQTKYFKNNRDGCVLMC